MEKNNPSEDSIRNKKTRYLLYNHEQNMWQKDQLICGVDEVGRGSLLGPIVTVAAILNPNSFHPELKDSKETTPQQRNELFKWAINNCSYSIGINSNHFIEGQNIYKGTQITMTQSIYNLLYKAKKEPALILIDAMPLSLEKTRFRNITIKSLIQGESKSASIAIASIIAKVIRDNIMKKHHLSFPEYKINQHQGYGTSTHFKLIQKHGPSFIHRVSFLKKTTKATNEQLSLFC